MVTQASIIQLLQNPEDLSVIEKSDLKTLCADFPYFVAPKIWLAKYDKEEGSPNYKTSLKQAALACPDRKELYRYLIKQEIQQHIATIVDVIRDNEEVSKNLETSLKSNDLLISVSSSEQNPENALELVTDQVIDDLIKEAYIPSYSIELAFPKKTEDIPHEEIETSIASNIEIDEKTTPLEKTFLGWLDTFGKDSEPAQEEIAQSTDDIISKFIDNSPRIGHLKLNNNFEVALEAQQQDRAQMVTETLARVYLKQKNYARAVKVYQQLMLNIPEKKGYFASQIHFLEELLRKD